MCNHGCVHSNLTNTLCENESSIEKASLMYYFNNSIWCREFKYACASSWSVFYSFLCDLYFSRYCPYTNPCCNRFILVNFIDSFYNVSTGNGVRHLNIFSWKARHPRMITAPAHPFVTRSSSEKGMMIKCIFEKDKQPSVAIYTCFPTNPYNL